MEHEKLKSLYHKHAYKVAVVRSWSSEGEGIPHYKAWLHAEQLLRLDILIIEHRKKFTTPWEPLLGKRALNHLLFVRTGWSPSVISQLSFEDMLLGLHQDLVNLDIPSEILELPENIKQSRAFAIHNQEPHRTQLLPFLEQEWDPTLSEVIQGIRKPY